MSLGHEKDLELLAARRWRVALTLTIIMVSAYFGFILLIAYDKPLMGQLVMGGSVSIGVLLGAAVIALAPVLTGIYVRWTNQHYDHAIGTINGLKRDAEAISSGTTVAPAPAVPPVGTFARARTPLPVAQGTDPAAPSSTASPAQPRPEVRQ
jgi:uncharacterized membrane protein (DUF485 family)